MRPRKNRPPGRSAQTGAGAADGTPNPTRTPRWMREYVREHLLPAVVDRLYTIGMGVTRFEVVTMTGKKVRVPASPAVQVRALDSLKQLGIPTQVGISDDDGISLPGVIVLPPLDPTEAVNMAADAVEYIDEDVHPTTSTPDTPPATDSTVSPAVVQRIRARRQAASPDTPETNT